MARATVTGEVVGVFVGKALLWAIPALLLLPFYLVLVAISVAASEGGLLELVAGAKGGIHSALGVLLVVAGVGLAVVLVMHATTSDDWITGGFAVLVLVGLGVYFVDRELQRIARGR